MFFKKLIEMLFPPKAPKQTSDAYDEANEKEILDFAQEMNEKVVAPKKMERPVSSIKLRSSDERYEYAQKLIKEATAHKKEDIHKSISLISEAIDVYPEGKIDFSYKLASYINLSGDKEEAYATFDRIFNDLSVADYSMYNMHVASTFDKLKSVYFTNKEYAEYLRCFCYWLYNYIVGIASHGIEDQLNNFLSSDDMLKYNAPKRNQSCFKKLGIENDMGTFNEKLVSYFKKINKQLIEYSKIAKKLEFVIIDGDINSSHYFNSLPKTKQELAHKFKARYDDFNGEDFSSFYKNEIEPLLLQRQQ